MDFEEILMFGLAYCSQLCYNWPIKFLRQVHIVRDEESRSENDATVLEPHSGEARFSRVPKGQTASRRNLSGKRTELSF